MQKTSWKREQKYKKRLHGQKAGISILVALIIISLAEVVFRAVALREIIFTAPNFGKPLAAIVLCAFIIIMTIKGKDRICSICYGAWLGCFALDQLFGLPGMILYPCYWCAFCRMYEWWNYPQSYFSPSSHTTAPRHCSRKPIFPSKIHNGAREISLLAR